jgi:hypothetical protein
MDIPTLRDQDDGPGLYYAVLPTEAGWSGAQIYRSIDDTATWQNIGATASEGQGGYADSTLSWQGGTTE